MINSPRAANDLDPQLNIQLGDYFADYVGQQARSLGLTLDALRTWAPVEPTRGGRVRKEQKEDR